MKSLKNERVEHKRFGLGIIISEETGKVKVEFDSQIGNKIFQFPEAFEEFLKLEDKSLQEEIFILVQAKKQQIADENMKKRLELEKQEEERIKELELTKKKKKVTKAKEPKVAKQSVKKTSKPSEDELSEDIDND